jgi:hypothetical protein
MVPHPRAGRPTIGVVASRTWMRWPTSSAIPSFVTLGLVMTALRDKLRARAQPLLEPGEQIQEIFPARTILRGGGGVAAKRWIVAATDRNIVVFFAQPFSPTTPRSVALRLARETRLGPVHGIMGVAELNVKVEGRTILAQRRFYPDVERADAR